MIGKIWQSTRLAMALVAVLAAAACLPEKKVRPAMDTLNQYVKQAHSRAANVVNSPGSLFNQAGTTRDYYTDPKTHYIDDIVTILVSESTNALSSADTTTSAQHSANTSINSLAGLQYRWPEMAKLIDATGKRGFTGKGSTDRTSTLSATVAARVVDVMPNGSLVLEGAREITINNEHQVIIISGVIRPDDISSANVVSSNNIANLQIRLEGNGHVARDIKPGWLYQILSSILPF